MSPLDGGVSSTAVKVTKPESRDNSNRYFVDSAGPVMFACAATSVGAFPTIVTPSAGLLALGAPVTTGVHNSNCDAG